MLPLGELAIQKTVGKRLTVHSSIQQIVMTYQSAGWDMVKSAPLYKTQGLLSIEIELI